MCAPAHCQICAPTHNPVLCALAAHAVRGTSAARGWQGVRAAFAVRAKHDRGCARCERLLVQNLAKAVRACVTGGGR